MECIFFAGMFSLLYFHIVPTQPTVLFMILGSSTVLEMLLSDFNAYLL